jgi:U4/U6 small nuclear ribonucleoprotein PRP4
MDHDHLLSAGPGAAPEKASAILAQFSRKKLAAQIAVPTDDRRVREHLRRLAEPMTLFGEDLAERRDRLRELLTRQAEDDDDEDVSMAGAEDDGGRGEEEYYTEGSRELVDARRDIARYSLPRAKRRIAFQRAESTIALRTHVKVRKAIKELLGGFGLLGSQIASERALAGLRLSPDGNTVAVGSWSGSVKLMALPNIEERTVLRGHNDIVSGIAWRPGATLGGSNVAAGDVNLATGGGDGSINLWSLEQDTPIATLRGHSARVAKVEFHPMGRHLASASYDGTWRLWDVSTQQELLAQEGHSRECHTVALNEDGSLLASGGLDSVGRVWDLRTGRTVMYLDSHMLPVYALDWGADGFRLLSGSSDGFMKCWDVRQVRETASVGAHTDGVTDVRWFKGTDGPAAAALPAKDDKGEWVPKKSGTFVVTAGFDKAVKIFSADDWALCATLRGHVSNITGVDVTGDGRLIVSSGRDRTIKLWGRDDDAGIYSV